MATMQIPQLDPIRPARPFQLRSSRFDGSTGPRIIGPRDGKFVDLQAVAVTSRKARGFRRSDSPGFPDRHRG
jgi:hypothetical protein